MFRRILVTVDGSPTSMRGLKAALDLALDQRASLDVLHIVDDMAITPALSVGYAPANYIESILQSLRDGGRKILAKAEALARDRGVEARPLLVETRGQTVAHAILQQARKQKSDVIVLGTHGRRGIRRILLGSDAETVVRESPVPVLLVRGVASPRRATPSKAAGSKTAARR
ncbi:MAG TPA: universal stress protein [Casimicrobiaceae bacterium]|nr:universal stress protein [Casimicrobiaceae bacterium]